jgi:hypothetical protein
MAHDRTTFFVPSTPVTCPAGAPSRTTGAAAAVGVAVSADAGLAATYGAAMPAARTTVAAATTRRRRVVEVLFTVLLG